MKECVMYAMGVLVNCTSWHDWLEVASALLIVLKSPHEDALVEKERLILTTRIKREKGIMDITISGDEGDTNKAGDDDQGSSTDTKSSSLRESSPFSLAVKKRLKCKMATKSNGNNIRGNELTNPDLAKYLETHMLPLAPLWSGMMLGQ